MITDVVDLIVIGLLVIAVAVTWRAGQRHAHALARDLADRASRDGPDEAYDSIPSTDETVGWDKPQATLTRREKTQLGAIQAWRPHANPAAAQAAHAIADGLRLRFPTLDDTTLGLITLDLFGYLRALATGLPDPAIALRGAADGFALAAEELTRLGRTDVTLDQQ